MTELPIFGQLNLGHPRRVDLGRRSEFAFSLIKDFVADVNDLLFQCAHGFSLPYFSGKKNVGFVLRQQSQSGKTVTPSKSTNGIGRWLFPLRANLTSLRTWLSEQDRSNAASLTVTCSFAFIKASCARNLVGASSLA